MYALHAPYLRFAEIPQYLASSISDPSHTAHVSGPSDGERESRCSPHHCSWSAMPSGSATAASRPAPRRSGRAKGGPRGRRRVRLRQSWRTLRASWPCPRWTSWRCAAAHPGPLRLRSTLTPQYQVLSDYGIPTFWAVPCLHPAKEATCSGTVCKGYKVTSKLYVYIHI